MSEHLDEKLSAFLDGALSPADTQEIERLVETDPDLAARLEQLLETNDAAHKAFDQMLDDAVPFALAKTIIEAEPHEETSTAPSTRKPLKQASMISRFALVAASAALLVAGGLGGYMAGFVTSPVQVAQAGWVNDIIDYHRVYAAQKRHLVEVPASEKTHIEQWLTASVGTSVVVPDFSADGLTFEGARLLVAGGAPVAQLLFTDADEQVFALCIKQAKDNSDKAFKASDIEGFATVTWRQNSADFIVVGPENESVIKQMAKITAENA